MGTALARGMVFAGLAFAGPLAHAEVEVVSHRPDSVSITIYRDVFALITETRTVDLPEGAATLSFENVAETLLPASAVVADTGRALRERNFDYDALTPNNLFAKSIGEEVLLTRTLPGSGKVVRTRATITAANSAGITLQGADGLEALHCSGLPEQVTFSRVPDGLHARPKLSIRLAAGPAGKRTVRLSYLAHGFAWKSDYVARLDSLGTRAELRGWLTLHNATNASFRDAQVQVVAGNLNLLAEWDEGTSVFGPTGDMDPADHRSQREGALTEIVEELAQSDVSLRLFAGCHAIPSPEIRMYRQSTAAPYAVQSLEMADISEVMVTGQRISAMAAREELADYQLYRLPWPTDLNARQTKQAVFVDKKAVKVDRFYRHFVDALECDSSENDARAQLIVGLDNRKSAGLGEPLPEGVLRMFEPGANGDLFAGEGSFADSAVGTPLEIHLANSLDLSIGCQFTEQPVRDREGAITADGGVVDVKIANAKGLPVTVEIRQPMSEEMADVILDRASRRTQRKFGDYAWRFRVAANSVGSLSYRLLEPIRDEDDDE